MPAVCVLSPVAQEDAEVLAAIPRRGRAGHYGAGGGAIGGLDQLGELPWALDGAMPPGVGGQPGAGELPQPRVGRRWRHVSGDRRVQFGMVIDRVHSPGKVSRMVWVVCWVRSVAVK